MQDRSHRPRRTLMAAAVAAALGVIGSAAHATVIDAEFGTFKQLNNNRRAPQVVDASAFRIGEATRVQGEFRHGHLNYTDRFTVDLGNAADGGASYIQQTLTGITPHGRVYVAVDNTPHNGPMDARTFDREWQSADFADPAFGPQLLIANVDATTGKVVENGERGVNLHHNWRVRGPSHRGIGGSGSTDIDFRVGASGEATIAITGAHSGWGTPASPVSRGDDFKYSLRETHPEFQGTFGEGQFERMNASGRLDYLWLDGNGRSNLEFQQAKSQHRQSGTLDVYVLDEEKWNATYRFADDMFSFESEDRDNFSLTNLTPGTLFRITGSVAPEVGELELIYRDDTGSRIARGTVDSTTGKETITGIVSSTGRINFTVDHDAIYGDNGFVSVDGLYDLDIELLDPTNSDAIILPDNCGGGMCTAPEFVFNLDVTERDQGFLIDPPVVNIYEYEASGLPFASLILPNVGDGVFDVSFIDDAGMDRVETVTAGERLEFGGGGVTRFVVSDIEPEAGLDPNDPNVFPVYITFEGTGQANVIQTPRTVEFGGATVATVSEPATLGLVSLALAGLGARRRRAAG